MAYQLITKKPMSRKAVADEFYNYYPGHKEYGTQGGNYAISGSREVFICTDGWLSTAGGRVLAEISAIKKSNSGDELLARKFLITPLLAGEPETKQTIKQLQAALSGK